MSKWRFQGDSYVGVQIEWTGTGKRFYFEDHVWSLGASIFYEGEVKELVLLLYGPSKLTSSPKHVLPQTTFPSSGEERPG